MARARTIKQGYFTNDQLGRLPKGTRLLFAGLWTIADREGRLLDRPTKIKTEVLPYDDDDVDQALQQLADAGFIVRYIRNGKNLVQVVNWTKHQHPHPKEVASELPPPPRTKRATAQPRQSKGSASDEHVRSPVSGSLTGPSPSGPRETPSRRARGRGRAREDGHLGQSINATNACAACGVTLKAGDQRRKLGLCGECHGLALFAAARGGQHVELLSVQDLIDLATHARNGGATIAVP